MTAPLLAFENVVLAGSRPIRVHLEVPAHRAVSVVGEVVTGVERLGAMALGLVRPAEGRIRLLGEVLADMGRHTLLAFRRRVGYVPEGDGLLQNLSLADNVALPLRFGSNRSPREIRGRLRVVLGAFRLADVADRRPAEVNDEQRRRAAFARATVFDPPLVVAEQPFDGIGMRAAGELIDLARGGETDDGPRRSVLVVCQALPDRLRARFELRYRTAGGELRSDT